MELKNEEPVSNFTPLNIYNGTLESVPKNMEGQLLPINELKGNPPVEDCPISNLHRFKEMMNEQHESLFEPISKIEETNNENRVEKTDKDVDTKSNLELEQVKEPEPLHLCSFKTPTLWASLPKGRESQQGDADCAFQMRNGVKEVDLSKEPEPVKDESKKSIWHYLNPLSWKFSKV